jgi:hypothetical protein
VLCETQSALSDRFAGRTENGGADPRFDVVRSYWGGDHSLFLGRVEYARQHPGTPLLFHRGRYERLGSS